MDIKTRLNIEQECFTMINNKMIKCVVQSIIINIWKTNKIEIKYKLKESDGVVSSQYFHEEVVFATHEELTNYLTSSFTMEELCS